MSNRIATKVAFFIACLVATFVPASAKDDYNFAYQQNPTSTQLNGIQRNESLATGTFLYDLFGNTPKYANLAVTPSSGLYVQVAPAITNTKGAVYVTMPDDTSPFGTGPTALSADPTLIVRQGLISAPPISLAVPAPSGSSTSIAYLVECTVVRADANQIQYNFINNANQVTQGTVYENRQDTVSCVTKASTAAASPTLPSADTNYAAVAQVVVPNGATATSGAMITMLTGSQIGSLLQSYGGATITADGCFVTGGSSLCQTSGTVNGTLTSGNGQFVTATNTSINLCPYNTCTVTASTSGESIQGALSTTGAIASSASVAAPSGTFNAVQSLVLGTSAGNGTINVPGTGALYTNYFSGTNGVLFCNGAESCPASVSAAGIITTNNSLYAGNAYIGSGAATLGLNSGFSNTVPVISNSGDGGQNYSVGTNTSLGFRWFKGTTPTQLAQLDPSGNFTATGFGSFLSLSSTGNIQSNNGTFTAGSAAMSLCAVSACNVSIQAGGALNAAGTITSSSGFTVGSSTFSATGLTVNGDILSVNGTYTAGTTAGNILQLCYSTTTATCTLRLNSTSLYYSGPMYATAFNQTSRRALKRDIHPVTEDPLTVIGTISPQWWNYKREPAGTPPHLGLIADDTHSDISGPKKDHLDVGALAVMDAAAINELAKHATSVSAAPSRAVDERIADLQRQINLLYREMAVLAAIVVGTLLLVFFIFVRRGAAHVS